MSTADQLQAFTKSKPFFVGIDSDGCAFDTMEIKHKECFCPPYIKHWHLQPVSKYAREAWEFANLYSTWRGANRFVTLLKCFDLLAERTEVAARGVTMPDVPSLRAWVEQETKLGNPALEAKVKETGDAVLAQALEWSQAVNAYVADIVHDCPPYPHVRESIDKLSSHADMMVVSSTPVAALEREWHEHGLEPYVALICGQETGSKKEVIKVAVGAGYEPDHVLMIGDAPGDRNAAEANDALFYPIMPGDEEAAWQRFHEEAAGKFLDGSYAGAYEADLIAAFNKVLPQTPPWEK